jgi:hypothetical protein
MRECVRISFFLVFQLCFHACAYQSFICVQQSSVHVKHATLHFVHIISGLYVGHVCMCICMRFSCFCFFVLVCLHILRMSAHQAPEYTHAIASHMLDTLMRSTQPCFLLHFAHNYALHIIILTITLPTQAHLCTSLPSTHMHAP